MRWQARDGGEVTAAMTLPPSLGWSLIRGARDPVLGWYFPAFGQKVPATDVIGVGSATTGSPLQTAPRLLNLAWVAIPRPNARF